MNILGSLLTGFSWRSDTVGGYDGDHCIMGGRSTRPHCDRPSSACGKKVVVKQRLVLPSYFESQWPKRDLWGYEEERLFIMHSHSGRSWIDFGTTWSHYTVDCNCFFSPPSLPLACYLTRLYDQLVCSRVVLAYFFCICLVKFALVFYKWILRKLDVGMLHLMWYWHYSSFKFGLMRLKVDIRLQWSTDLFCWIELCSCSCTF